MELELHLDVLGELLVALLVVVFVLGEFGEELHALLDQVLADDFKDLALLKHLSGDVERQILRVHDTLDEVWEEKMIILKLTEQNKQLGGVRYDLCDAETRRNPVLKTECSV